MLTDFQEDVQEDWGWKLVHGEVFRAPRNPLLLSVLAGNGAQLSAMVGITLGQSLDPYLALASSPVIQSLLYLGFYLLRTEVPLRL